MKVSAAAIGRLLEESATRPGTLDFGLQLAEQRTVANLGACGQWSQKRRDGPA